MPDSPSSPDAPGQRWERLARSPRAGLALIALLLAVYLPGLTTIPAVDRDEARFAQASRQMFESVALPPGDRDTRPIARSASGSLSGGRHAGGLVVPMVGERPRLNKPPLVYWLQSASAALFTLGDPLRDAVWMYRVPSLLSAVVASLITWRFGRTVLPARAAWLAGATLGVCPMVVWDAHQARADQLLLACTTGALASLGTIFLRRNDPRTAVNARLTPAAFWVSVALGLLAKGPVTPMIALLAALGASWFARDLRWLRRTRPLLGLLILAAALTPWVVATARVVGWGTLVEVLRDETLGRSTEPKEGHWGPPGYHLVLLPLLYWPGSLLTLHALLRLRPDLRAGTPFRDAARYLCAWILPAWVVFELVGTKLPHYALPLYPAVALATMRAVIDLNDRAHAPARRVPDLPGLILWSLLGLGLLAGAPVLVATLDAGPLVLAASIANAAVCTLLVVLSARAARRQETARSVVIAVGAMVCFVFTLLATVLPNARDLRVTARLAAFIDQLPPGTPVATTSYREDSLVFATRARLAYTPKDSAAAWAVANPTGLLITDADTPAPAGWHAVASVTGLNYSKGDRVDLRLLRAGDAPAD